MKPLIIKTTSLSLMKSWLILIFVFMSQYAFSQNSTPADVDTQNDPINNSTSSRNSSPSDSDIQNSSTYSTRHSSPSDSDIHNNSSPASHNSTPSDINLQRSKYNGRENRFNYSLRAEESLDCPPSGPVLGSFLENNIQTGRINRDGSASSCLGKSYPGDFDLGVDFYYETYSYTNTSATPACVLVSFDPTIGANPCSDNVNFFDAHIAAYIGSYDPNDQAANYVGDLGNSMMGSFTVEIPGNSDLVIVVSNTSGIQECEYAFEVEGLPCVSSNLVIPTLSQWGIITLAVIMLIFGIIVVRQRRQIFS